MTPLKIAYTRPLPLLVMAAIGAAAHPAHLPAPRVLPAFPGAEGFGSTTPGGRGGRVLEVTHLGDTGPGSLREALEATGPRIIVFRTGGTLEVNSPLQIKNPFVTIAGHTAPGGGITLKNGPGNLYAPLQIKTHDVVLRYLRSRPGPSSKPSSNVDALTIADPERQVYNVIVDHCSFSWSVDEVVNSWYAARDITVQWSIMAEGLHKSNHPQGPAGKGPLFGGKGSDRISVHHNLMAHNLGRNPMIKTGGTVDLVNNVMFIPAAVGAVVDGELGPARVNVVGNQLIAPHGDGLAYGVAVLGSLPVSLYIKGNLGPYRREENQGEELFVRPQNQGRTWLTPQRHEAPPVSTQTAMEAYERVLAGAGCRLPRRDPVDQRVLGDVRARRTRIVNHPSEVGGWPALDRGTPPRDGDRDGMPDDWERAHQLDPADPADASRDRDGDGYTNVEEFLNREA